MENTNQTNQVTNQIPTTNRRSVDDVIAQALGEVAPAPAPSSVPVPTPSPAAPVTPPTLVPEIQAGVDTLNEVTSALREISENTLATREATETAAVEAKLKNEKLPPIQPLSRRDTTNLLKVTELFQRRELKTEVYTLNGRAISIRLNARYDDLVKAVGLATNLIMDSGDNYIFGPNQAIITSLVFLREVTNIDLEFLVFPEIRISQLIETYDILKPLIDFVNDIADLEFSDARDWYTTQVRNSVTSANQYRNSAKGIVDALSEHNIKDQQTMAEQMSELDDDKMQQLISFIQKVEPKNK